MCGVWRKVATFRMENMREEDFQEIMRIQQLMTQRLMQEQKTDSKIDLLNIVNELSNNGKKRISTEAVLIEAQYSGLEESDAIRLLDDLQRDRLIRRNDGFIVRT